MFRGPVHIYEEGFERLTYSYGINNNRAVAYYGNSELLIDNRSKVKYYSSDGTMEIILNRITNEYEFTTYLGGDGYTANAVYRTNGDQNRDILYLHRNYQGSIVMISNSNRVIIEKRDFDVWGNIIKMLNENDDQIRNLVVLERGYTGHEHLQSFVLINMNARLYDPKLHRFLQPDNYIQDIFNPQNHNRYSYVMNNPTKYTDPTGEFWQTLIGAIFSSYAAGVNASGGQLNPFQWNSTAWTAAGLGAVSSLASTTASGYLNSYIENYKKIEIQNNSKNSPIFLKNNEFAGFNNSTELRNITSNEFNDVFDWIDLYDLKLEGEGNYYNSNNSTNSLCVYYSKLIIDKHYKIENSQIENNICLFERIRVTGRGLKFYDQIDYFEMNGFNTDEYKGSFYQSAYYPNNEFYDFVKSYISVGIVMQINWMPEQRGHSSLINKLQYNVYTNQHRIQITDPSSFGNFSLDKAYGVFAVWPRN